MDTHKNERSLGDLLKELGQESRTLFRKEVDLAKAELTDKARVFGRNLAAVAIGGFVILLGAIALMTAVVAGLSMALIKAGLTEHTAEFLSPLIIGIVIAVVGYVLLQKGLTALKNEGVTPRQTTQTLQENKEWMKEKLA